MNMDLKIACSSLAVLTCFASLIFGDGEPELTEENYNVTWMYFANGSDLPEVAYLTDPSQLKIYSFYDIPVEFELYTRKNEKIPIVVKYTQRQKREAWNPVIDNLHPELETKIIIHGWKSSSRSDTIQDIKSEYFKRSDYNVLAVNWEYQASSIFYILPVKYTRAVGRAIATLIDVLVEEGKIDSKRVHLIGHSLGAHAAGYAGSYSKHRVSRITGLDPASPAVEYIAGPEGRLDPTDADFVDVIHTCAGYFGFSEPIGHVDFYPNSGKPSQPGCTGLFNMTLACSHGRSHHFFSESINSNMGFYAYPCLSWEKFREGLCKQDPILMGDNASFTARGVYYLITKDAAPFALGNAK